MRNEKIDWVDLLFAIGVTIFFFMPYLTRSLLPFGHDTMFHCGRIAMLSEAMKNGNILPAVYPDANYGYGYATPLFYSDFFNLIPAALHAMGVPLAICYKLLVISMTFISVMTMLSLSKRVSGNRVCGWLSACAYLFANYHMSDIYVRGALGEIIALAFLPAVLEKIYAILYQKKNEWMGFGFSLACLLLSHNLTFLFGVFLIVLFFLIRIRQMDKRTFLTLFKGVVSAFLLTVFFSLPMLEQLRAQTLRVSLYGRYYDLGEQTMSFSQYFSNRMSYGLAGRNVENPMLENVGWFLTFAPLTYLFVQKDKKNSFVTTCFILGYIFWLAPGDLLPWSEIHFLGFIQFPWRLNTLTIVLLSMPAAYGISALSGKKHFIELLVFIALFTEGGWHLSSVYSRWYGIDNTMNWTNIREQKGITTYDPNRFPYKYEEVQGGEYLPVDSPDFTTRKDSVSDEKGKTRKVKVERSYNTFSLEVSEKGTYVLPLTWYKGYQIIHDGKSVEALRSKDGLVMLRAGESGLYTVQYKNTMLRKACMVLSLMTLIGLIMKKIYLSFSGEMRAKKISNSCLR